MRKKFLEAIPELEVTDDIRDILQHVWLTKVTQSKDQSIVHLYIESDMLIPKRTIYTLE